MTNAAEEIVRAMLGIDDPVSLPSEERHKQTRASEFFNAEEDDLVQAYLSIPVREKQPHFDSLFEFLINVRRYADAYQTSGELWINREKQHVSNGPPKTIFINFSLTLVSGLLRATFQIEEIRMPEHSIWTHIFPEEFIEFE